MKLVFCKTCQDVVKAGRSRTARCSCGASKARYAPDGRLAVYAGDAVPIGFANSSLAAALRKNGGNFSAFVIGPDCETYRKATPKGGYTDAE